ncbi:hypothetical protein DPMN_071554 [Dreissena polymorpha]|uniref:Uncharacterized protein n=1 Tax=Dreissena polymorpha TaxID=45954 RepID=A0A9D3Z4S7_DREPO|nr:hypothetical protein DPMN_071554 [Dreissena polymorpha]
MSRKWVMVVSRHYQFVPLIFLPVHGKNVGQKINVDSSKLECVSSDRWHRRINTRAGRADLGFYLLVPLLRREADTVDMTIRLVPEHALTLI